MAISAPNPFRFKVPTLSLGRGLGRTAPCLPSYRSEELVFGLACVRHPRWRGRVLSGPRRSSGGGAVVFVSVNQVLVRPWACRLSGGLPCRAVGCLTAVARAAVIAKSDRHGCCGVRSSDRRHERSGASRWSVSRDGGWAPQCVCIAWRASCAGRSDPVSLGVDGSCAWWRWTSWLGLRIKPRLQG